jgi:hypothetical protein
VQLFALQAYDTKNKSPFSVVYRQKTINQRTVLESFKIAIGSQESVKQLNCNAMCARVNKPKNRTRKRRLRTCFGHANRFERNERVPARFEQFHRLNAWCVSER